MAKDFAKSRQGVVEARGGNVEVRHRAQQMRPKRCHEHTFCAQRSNCRGGIQSGGRDIYDDNIRLHAREIETQAG